jgi:hypothetical protein
MYSHITRSETRSFIGSKRYRLTAHTLLSRADAVIE